MKKIIIILSIFVLCVANVSVANATTCESGCEIERILNIANDSDLSAPQDALNLKKYVLQQQKEKMVVYNALDLTPEQIFQREDLICLNYNEYEKLFNELIKESYTLKALKIADVSNSELRKQRKVVKNLKTKIQDMLDDENKTFKKSLTREQKSKYAMIKKLERNDYKKESHQKDYYKANPRLRQFGNTKTCN